MKYKYGWYILDTELNFEQCFQKSSNANGVFMNIKNFYESSPLHILKIEEWY